MNVATRWASDGRLNELALARRELAALGVDVVDLADTNPTRWGLGSEAALEVVADAARRSGRYDPAPRGPLAAREALAARFGGSPEDYWLTASTSEAYAWLFALLGDPGDAVGVPTPGYPLVEPLARYANLATVGYPSHYLHPYGWTLDTERLADVAARVKALVVVDPGNPTGAWTRDSEWAAIERTGVPVIVDRVFGEYALDAAASVPSDAGETALRGTFVLNGLSKLLCAPGLKLAWLHAPDVARDVARTLDEIADTFLPVSAVMGAALPGLLELADDVVAATRR
ncbi:MAG: pyridoxal phosphate-dependent aminotransferase, partial [Propionibacteriaceae bacterium]|nr:pyridoxal phosphate-dependent aminotransferase [Propionibacteriaceae bacterium]